MGLLDSLTGVFSGSGKHAQPIALEPGETELARVASCTLRGGASWFGGDLVLTDRRLLFTPLEVRDVAALLEYGLKKAGAPAGAGAVVGWMAKQGQHIPAELASITKVGRGGQAHGLHPATLIAQLADGRALEFGVFKSRLTRTGSSANNAARDKFSALVNATLV